jgi:hypothetical protein
MFADNHHNDGRIALWCAALPGAQALLMEADPKRFFIPPYVGKGGWIGIHLDRSNDALLGDVVKRAYCAIAPEKLRAVVQEAGAKPAKAGGPGAPASGRQRKAPVRRKP